MEALLRRLRDAEEESRESLELRSQLRDFAEQAMNRDQVLLEMRNVFKQQAREVYRGLGRRVGAVRERRTADSTRGGAFGWPLPSS